MICSSWSGFCLIAHVRPERPGPSRTHCVTVVPSSEGESSNPKAE